MAFQAAQKIKTVYFFTKFVPLARMTSSSKDFSLFFPIIPVNAVIREMFAGMLIILIYHKYKKCLNFSSKPKPECDPNNNRT